MPNTVNINSSFCGSCDMAQALAGRQEDQGSYCAPGSYLGNMQFFSSCAISYCINTAKKSPSFLGRARLTSEENYTGHPVSLVLTKSEEVRPVLRVHFSGDRKHLSGIPNCVKREKESSKVHPMSYIL